jgi:hypothetical protein
MTFSYGAERALERTADANVKLAEQTGRAADQLERIADVAVVLCLFVLKRDSNYSLTFNDVEERLYKVLHGVRRTAPTPTADPGKPYR